jgi:hypothetical protein
MATTVWFAPEPMRRSSECPVAWPTTDRLLPSAFLRLAFCSTPLPLTVKVNSPFTAPAGVPVLGPWRTVDEKSMTQVTPWFSF